MMSDTLHELVLHGVRPEPLASYLKGLGIIRLVAQQKEPGLRAFWRDDELVLVTSLDMEGLMDFFLTEYRPTPIVSPWHGSCGFYPETETVRHIRQSHDPRLERYRAVILMVQGYLTHNGINENPVNMKDKEMIRRIVRELRNQLPDDSIAWIDAAVVVLDQSLAEPGILGKGGSDAHLEFAHNFMQRIDSLLLGKESDFSKNALISALAGEESSSGSVLVDAASGQFDPGRAGGPNMTAGFGGAFQVNPWDYVLLIEGVTMLAAQPARRLYSSATQAAAAPFSTSCSPIGYESAASKERSRTGSSGEFWAPLWTKSLSISEIQMVFSEGRSNVARGHANTGLEFSIAVSNLGIDESVHEFARFGFLQRFGKKNHLATPLGRFVVRPGQHAALLEELVPWLARIENGGRDELPASTVSAKRLLENNMMEYARVPSSARAQDVLLSLVSLHRVLGRGKRDDRLRPLEPLSREWIKTCDDTSPEYALALSVAAWVATCRRIYLRELMMPVNRDERGWFAWNTGSGSIGKLTADPLRAMERLQEVVLAASPTDGAHLGPWAAAHSDVARFLDGEVDVRRTFDLIGALALVDVTAFFGVRSQRSATTAVPLPVTYCVVKPFFAPEARFVSMDGDAKLLMPTSPILSALERHDPAEAANAARAALIARGFVPVGVVRGGRTDPYHGPKWLVSPALRCHLYAGLLFPVQHVEVIMAQCLRQTQKEVSV